MGGEVENRCSSLVSSKIILHEVKVKSTPHSSTLSQANFNLFSRKYTVKHPIPFSKKGKKGEKIFFQDGPKPDDIIHHVITANKKSATLTSNASGEDRTMFMMDDVMTIFLVIVSFYN